MRYRYYICDVFTETRFGGNQLAVLPQAIGLSTQQMQQIAREFNFSETTFVFPSKAGHTRHVRIFTPAREIPFAGHPNVGTAFVLANAGEFGKSLDDQCVVVIEGFAPPRKQAYAAIRFDGDSAIAVEFDFVEPTRPVRQLCDGGAVHRFDEVGFSSR